jgi:hypothetical protein
MVFAKNPRLGGFEQPVGRIIFLIEGDIPT